MTTARIRELLSEMRQLGETEMGWLPYGLAARFHAATDLLQEVVDGEHETARCAFCDEDDDPSLPEVTSTATEWLCPCCGRWNDRP